MRGSFDNSGKLVKLIFRRERIMSAVWIVILVLFSVALAAGINEMFPDTEARSTFAQTIDNPIMVAMMGPVYGLDNYTSGAMYGGMMLLWYVIAVAVMNVFFVARHTRADEESGRGEVVRSLPVGRLSNINAAMVSAAVLNSVLGLLTGLGIAAMGIEGMGFAGSMVYGMASGAAGLVFAAIAALFCQLSSNTGGATGLSFAALGVLYMLRAAGDMQGSEVLACISPLGLVLRAQTFTGNRVWPILVLLLEAVVIAAAAYKLNTMRDLGQGFIAAKPGRREASRLLRSPAGLAVRLLRGMLITWAVVMLMLGASYGSVIADIGSFVGDSPEYMTVIGVPVEMLDTLSEADKEKLIVDSFGTFVTSMMTLLCLVPVLNAAMKPRAEEREGRTEHVIARVVPKVKYIAGYIIPAFIASFVIQAATAVGLYYATDAMAEVNPFTLGDLMTSFLAYLPAIWVMIGAAVLIVGLFPKATGAVWGYFGVVCFTSFVGGMVLPEWMLNISPLYHVPQPEPFKQFTLDFAPLAVLTVIAAALTAAGIIGYAKRDIRQG